MTSFMIGLLFIALGIGLTFTGFGLIIGVPLALFGIFMCIKGVFELIGGAARLATSSARNTEVASSGFIPQTNKPATSSTQPLDFVVYLITFFSAAFLTGVATALIWGFMSSFTVYDAVRNGVIAVIGVYAYRTRR